ncbi:glutathione S-transferase family protein [Agaribacterium sp. ZY112]|uniref:glutathione S-transferase family protein n=1 Tax=Agaribacterium sp. ZY112 TaxID=3233574 RepID=UPI0035236337
MYTLHNFPYSQHARRVFVLLEQAQLHYNIAPIRQVEDPQLRPELQALNPKHQLITLETASQLLSESHSILRLICSEHQLNDWYPEDHQLRATIDQWLDWNQCQLSPLVSELLWQQLLTPSAKQRLTVSSIRAKLEPFIEHLTEQLWHQSYVAGKSMSIADLSIATNVHQLLIAGELKPSAPLQVWYEKVSQLPGFQRTLKPLAS